MTIRKCSKQISILETKKSKQINSIHAINATKSNEHSIQYLSHSFILKCNIPWNFLEFFSRFIRQVYPSNVQYSIWQNWNFYNRRYFNIQSITNNFRFENQFFGIQNLTFFKPKIVLCLMMRIVALVNRFIVNL